jgi:hypothetical protein
MLNLRDLIKIGLARSELTPREMAALDIWRLFMRSTSIEELRIEQEACMRKLT